MDLSQNQTCLEINPSFEHVQEEQVVMYRKNEVSQMLCKLYRKKLVRQWYGKPVIGKPDGVKELKRVS